MSGLRRGCRTLGLSNLRYDTLAHPDIYTVNVPTPENAIFEPVYRSNFLRHGC